MNKARISKYWILLIVSAIVVLDEWLKYVSLLRLPDEGSLVDSKFIAFAIHKNWGVAFDIPFKLEFVILVTIVLGALLLQIAYKNYIKHPEIALSSLIIVVGALGNLFDRVYYGFTVDYIIFFGQSAINISDMVIISGVVMLLITSRNASNRLTTHKK